MSEYVKSVLIVLAGILAPAEALLISVGFLIFADFFTGIWAAKKRGEVITKSAGWRRSITKMTVYQVAVISGFLVETYMLDSFIPVSKIVASVIGLVELKSILENANSILGQDLFKTVLSKLGSDNDSLKDEIKKQIKDAVEQQLK
jgi:DNA-binding ferritin-like protein (Dps family)